MHEYRGQHIAWRSRAWHTGLALAWLFLLALLAAAAAAAVIAVYQAGAGIR